MRRLSFLFIFILCSYLFGEELHTDSYYAELLNTAIIEMDALVRNSKNNNESVISVYNYVFDKITSEELFFTVTDNSPSILSSITFSVKDNGKKWFAVDKALLDQLTKRKTLFFTILMHEYKHVYDYYNIANYQELMTNDLEKFLFEMDSYYIEALFVETYIDTSKYELGYFENYLIKSNKNDGLNSIAILLRQSDKPFVYKYYRAVREYNKGVLPIKSIFDDLVSEMDKAIMDFNRKEKTDWEEYIFFSYVHSIQLYTPKLLQQLQLINSNDKEYFNINTEVLDNKLNKLRELLFNDDILTRFNNYITTYLQNLGR